MLDRLPLACLHLAILGLLLLALGRLPGAWRAWGWRLALLKAAVLLVGAFSLPWLTVPEGSADSQSASGSRTLSPQKETPRPPINVAAPTAPSPPPPDPSPWLLLAWLGGASVLVTRRLLCARRPLGPLAPIPDHWNLSATVPIKISPAVPAPLIVGLIRPTVILPAWPEPPSGWQAALAHELAHARRRDVLWDTLVQALAALFWFHPVAWLAIREHRLACEEACDAEAMRTTSTSPREYALTLVHLGRPTPTGLALGAPARALRRRIQAMHRLPFSSRWALPLLALAAILVAPLELTAAPPPFQRISVSRFDHAAMNLLHRPGVMKELGLAPGDLKPTQVELEAPARTGKIGQDIARMKDRGVPVKERIAYENAEKERFYAEVTQSVLGQLSPAQVDRLRQIALQEFGPLSMAHPTVAKAAKLSPGTTEKIVRLRKECERETIGLLQADFRRRRDLVKAGTGLSPEERARYQKIRSNPMSSKEAEEVFALEKKIYKALGYPRVNPGQDLERRVWNKYNARAKSVLSDAERGRWKRLLGKPFPLPPVKEGR